MTEFERTNEPEWMGNDDLEALLDKDVDLEVVEAIKKDSSAPAGTYKSEPDEYKLSYSVGKFQDRTEITFSGMVTLVSVDKKNEPNFTMPDYPVRTRLSFFKISPDRRNKPVFGEDNKPTGEFTDKPDAQSLRWQEAVEAFKQVTGENPKKLSDVASFLTETPIYFKLFKGNKGLAVTRIYAKRA